MSESINRMVASLVAGEVVRSHIQAAIAAAAAAGCVARLDGITLTASAQIAMVEDLSAKANLEIEPAPILPSPRAQTAAPRPSPRGRRDSGGDSAGKPWLQYSEKERKAGTAPKLTCVTCGAGDLVRVSKETGECQACVNRKKKVS